MYVFEMEELTTFHLSVPTVVIVLEAKIGERVFDCVILQFTRCL